jgi:glutathione S-transferase
MTELQLIGAPQSIYVRTVRMACLEKGVAYRLVPERPNSDAVAAISPFGRIPVLRHGDLTLFESKAIATYIDRAFPGPALVPAEAEAAARVEQWISAAITTLLPALSDYCRAYVFPRTPDGTPDRPAIEASLPALRQHLELLDRTLAGSDCLAGPSLTLADLYVLPILGYLQGFPESVEILAPLRHLGAYFGTQAQRPSFRETVPPPMSEFIRQMVDSAA